MAHFTQNEVLDAVVMITRSNEIKIVKGMKAVILFCFLINCTDAFTSSITLDQRDAEVWYIHQQFSGRVLELGVREVIVHHNDEVMTAPITAGRFLFKLTMQPGDNVVWVEAATGNNRIKSDLVKYRLMYKPLPTVRPLVKIAGDTAILRSDVLENPYGIALSFNWAACKDNPRLAEISSAHKPTAIAVIPKQNGKYYFDLLVVSGKDSVKFRTYCVRNAGELSGFSIETDYSTWINDAIIYEITPYKFVENGTFADITAKLPELRSLGINTIWLQPVFSSFQKGQGYDVVNYHSVNVQLGSEQNLRTLISTAKNMGMRVIFDIVLNHTSIHHRYAKNLVTYGEQSHYYNYYQHYFDGAPYSSFYNKDPDGFVYYFWKDLVNLNFDNEEVQQWMIEVCKYWLREFKIDGFRFDAIWGVNARKSSFSRRLRNELKSINPDALLLAEDKPLPSVYKNGFDVAYDWTTDTSWVSQWSWQYQYHERKNFTIFNHPEAQSRTAMLANAIFQPNNSAHPRLRFMENNDLPRFIDGHSIEQTRMVAALLFSLDGIPMIYNGQEIGFPIHPYNKGAFFKKDQPIVSLDTTGMFRFYKKLIAARNKYSALRRGDITKVYQSSEQGVLGFRRSTEKEVIHVFINLTDIPQSIDMGKLMDKGTRPAAIVDLITDEEFAFDTKASQQQVSLPGYSTRWLVLKK